MWTDEGNLSGLALLFMSVLHMYLSMCVCVFVLQRCDLALLCASKRSSVQWHAYFTVRCEGHLLPQWCCYVEDSSRWTRPALAGCLSLAEEQPAAASQADSAGCSNVRVPKIDSVPLCQVVAESLWKPAATSFVRASYLRCAFSKMNIYTFGCTASASQLQKPQASGFWSFENVLH